MKGTWIEMKVERQSKIIDLITHFEIDTQEELAHRLTESGFDVTQATISRDIRDLKLTKATDGNGKQKYIVMPTKQSNLNEKYIRIFRNGYNGIDRAQGMVVVKTLTGMAMAVAAAIDAMNFEEIVGSIAGDDTIFCATRSDSEGISLMEKLKKLSNG